MNYTPLQLDIIREFGNKELSRGCFLKVNGRISICNDGPYYEDEGRLYARNSEKSPEENIIKDFEILGHIPHLFPDVARVAKGKGYSIEVVKGDMFTSLIKISRWNIVEPTIIEFKDTLQLLDQDESTLTQLLTLFATGETNE